MPKNINDTLMSYLTGVLPDLFKKSLRKRALLAVISGLAAFAAFPPLELPFTAWLAFIPLFHVIATSGYRKSFWYSYLAGVVFFASVLYWLTVVSVPGFILLSLLLAVIFGLFGLMSRFVMKYSINLLAIPFAWVVLEYVRAHLFTGFPWALLGYSQYTNINLIQIADMTGAYGVSFLLMTFNVAVWAWLAGSRRKVSYLMISLLLIIAATSYGMYRRDNMPEGSPARISVVQGNIEQDLKWDQRSAEAIIDKYTDLTRNALADAPDIIIWPETSYPYLLRDVDMAGSPMAELSEEAGTPILAGVAYERDDVMYNSAVLFTGAEKQPEIYRKVHLVPFGEYIPFEERLGPLRKYIDKPIGDFRPGNDYKIFSFRSVTRSGDHRSMLVRRTTFHKLGVLICFEDVFPYIARNFAREGAGILANITNDAWFGRTAASRQHLQASVFRAVENRVPVVRAANTGISAFVDIFGKVISRVEVDGREIFVEGYDTREIMTVPVKSAYTEYGDIFVFFAGFFLLFLVITEKFLSLTKK